jgi:hypothetical protein
MFPRLSPATQTESDAQARLVIPAGSSLVMFHDARSPVGAVEANSTLCCADDTPAMKHSD